MNPSDFGADIFEPDDQPPRQEAAEASPAGPKKKRRRRKAAPALDDATADAAGADDLSAPETAVPEAPIASEAPAEDGAPRPGRKRQRRRRPHREDEVQREDEAPRAEDETGFEPPEPPPGLWDEDEAPPPAFVDEDLDAEPADQDEATERAFDAEPDADWAEGESADGEGPEDTEAPPGDEAEGQAPRGDEGWETSRDGRRRRRRRRGRGRRDEEEVAVESEEPPPRREPRRERRTDRMFPVPTLDGEVKGQRIAVLIHLDQLAVDSRESGGEVAWGKLVQHVARRRHLIRAIAYAVGRSPATPTLRGNGIEVQELANEFELPVQMTVDAMSLANRVDCVVFVPGPVHVDPLAAALRARGVRIEAAGFTANEAPVDETVQMRHRLGAESLFVP